MFPGGGELLLILVVILLLFGGREMPKIMRNLGRWSAIARKSFNEVKSEFNRIGIEEELREKTDRDKKELEEEKKNTPQKKSDKDS